MGERIDIVVSETGATQAAGNIAAIGSAADKAAVSVDKVKGSSAALGTTAAAAATPLQATATAAAAAGSSLGNLAPAAAVANTNLSNVAKTAGGAVTPAVNDLSGAVNLLKLAFAGLVVDRVIEGYTKISDTFTGIINRLKLVTKSSQELAQTEQELFEMSNRTRSSFEATSNLYLKLASNSTSLGLDLKTIIPTIETVNQLIAVSGATAIEAKAGLLQFSQGLASNRFQGDELRSVLENLPALGQQIAKGLNVTTGELREMGKNGQLTAKLILDAIAKGAPEVAKQFAAIKPTISGAFQVLQNNLLQLVGTWDQLNNGGSRVAAMILFLADNMGTLARIFGVAAAAVTAFYTAILVQGAYASVLAWLTRINVALQTYVVAMAAAGVETTVFSRLQVALAASTGGLTGAIQLLWATVRAHPFVAILTVLGLIAGALYFFGQSVKLNSDGSITALGAVVGILNTLWDVMKTIGGWIATVFGPIFTGLGNIIQTVFFGALAIVQRFLTFLSTFFPSLEGANNSLTKFGAQVVQNMKDATASMNAASLASKDFGAGFGGALDGASNAAGKLGASAKLAGDGLTQLGRVIAADIPPFENLVMAEERATAGAKKMAEIHERLQKEMAETRAETLRLALTTRNAFGDMVEATDAWALRSGAAFNQVKGQAASVAAETVDAMAQITAAANQASAAVQQASSSSADSLYAVPDSEVTQYFTSAGGSDGEARAIIGLVNQFGAALGTPQAATYLTQISKALQSMSPATKNVVTSNYPWVKSYLESAGLAFAQGGSFMVGGSGGTDSQLVQFWASPDERVSVQTPAQQREHGGGGGMSKTVIVNMNVTTKDANSFRRSKNQNYLELKAKLAGV